MIDSKVFFMVIAVPAALIMFLALATMGGDEKEGDFRKECAATGGQLQVSGGAHFDKCLYPPGVNPDN